MCASSMAWRPNLKGWCGAVTSMRRRHRPRECLMWGSEMPDPLSRRQLLGSSDGGKASLRWGILGCCLVDGAGLRVVLVDDFGWNEMVIYRGFYPVFFILSSSKSFGSFVYLPVIQIHESTPSHISAFCYSDRTHLLITPNPTHHFPSPSSFTLNSNTTVVPA